MDSSAPQLILHPGFHRTGCRSVQRFLRVNEAALPDLTTLTSGAMRPVTALCQRFARVSDPLALAAIPEALETLLKGLSGPIGNLVISAEDLCGQIPGIRAVQDYRATPALLHQIVTALKNVLPQHRVTVVLGQRNSDDWLFSLYRHHLASRRLVLKRSEFEAIFQGAADLGRARTAVQAALSDTPVACLDLAQAGTHLFGPGGALLDAFGLLPADTAALVTVHAINRSPPAEVWPDFYRLNRRIKVDADLRVAKDDLLAAFAKQKD